MKIAFLWTGLSGYLNACLKELAGRDGVNLFVAHEAPGGNAPFNDESFAWIQERFVWRSSCPENELRKRLAAFQPDLLVVAGWHVPAYRKIALDYAGKCWRVMTMDNCWLATFKQWTGVLAAPSYVRPLADAVWLPGERQAIFARRLGFEERVILRGLYSCDHPAFAAAHQARMAAERPVQHKFLFVGRFVPEKGIETLVQAYQAYRASATEPWPLICCGEGPLRHLLEDQPGIRVEGFVQPEQLPSIMASVGCLVLPSKSEPWALVVHEAAAAGLPILASDKVGAAVHLVQPNFNGFIFGDRDVAGLAGLMARMNSMSDRRLNEMSQASYLLSQQYTPRGWADTLTESFKALAQKA